MGISPFIDLGKMLMDGSNSGDWGGPVGEDETSDPANTWTSMQKYVTPDTAGSVEQSEMLNQGLGVTNMTIQDPSQVAQKEIPDSGGNGSGITGMATSLATTLLDFGAGLFGGKQGGLFSGMNNEINAAFNGQGSYKNYQKMINGQYYFDEQGRMFLNKDVVDLRGYTGGTAIKRSGIY